MMGALYSGITGLKANEDVMNILSNNIANVNTMGFKKSSGIFYDILSTSLVSGASNMSIGRGTYMGSVDTDFVQGAFQKTENVTDLAIEGDGFFVLKNANSDSNLFYTRNGQFHIDKDGFLVTSDNLRVQGFMLNPETGEIDYTQETDIQITNALASSNPTRNVELGLNLDADAVTGSSGAYSATLTTYDSLGREIPLTFTFTRTDQLNTWTIDPSISSEYGTVDTGVLMADETLGAPAGNPFTITRVGMDTSTLHFWDNDGAVPPVLTDLGPFEVITTGVPSAGQVLVEEDAVAGTTTITFSAEDLATGGALDGVNEIHAGYRYSDPTVESTPITITFDSQGKLATIDGKPVETGGYNFPVRLNLTDGAESPQNLSVDIEEISQYASASTTKKLSQDGYGAGSLQNLEFASDGFVTGHFTNGLSLEIGRLVLGNFNCAEGLAKAGDTRYIATRESGQSIHNVPGSGLATVASYSLELANVDMATEFVNLITAQRAYTANAKVVSTSDSMLSDLMSIKR
jgi:flagellar hook protein FlgE